MNLTNQESPPGVLRSPLKIGDAPAKPAQAKRRPLIDDLNCYVVAKWPRCRWCKSIDLRTKKTVCTDGESVTRRVICRACGRDQILLME